MPFDITVGRTEDDKKLLSETEANKLDNITAQAYNEFYKKSS